MYRDKLSSFCRMCWPWLNVPPPTFRIDLSTLASTRNGLICSTAYSKWQLHKEKHSPSDMLQPKSMIHMS